MTLMSHLYRVNLTSVYSASIFTWHGDFITPFTSYIHISLLRKSIVTAEIRTKYFQIIKGFLNIALIKCIIAGNVLH
jgi:hypothetical protein